MRQVVGNDIMYSLQAHVSLGAALAGLIRTLCVYQPSRNMRFPTVWYVRPAKPKISLRIRAV